MDKYITRDKLLYHPERVVKWLQNEIVTPVTVQFQPCNICNQKCIYCVAEEQKDGSVIETKDAFRVIDKLSSLDVKGITISGGGEPTLHHEIDKIIEYAVRKKIEVGIETNGVNLNDRLLEVIIRNVIWIRFSLDSIDDNNYFKHRGSRDLDTVLNNLHMLILKKKQFGSHLTIGAQSVITKDNYQDIRKTAEYLKQIGLNYYYIRPLENESYSDDILPLIKTEIRLTKHLFETDTYTIIVSEKWKQIEVQFDLGRREYTRCWCYPFIGTIDAHGDIYICCHMSQISKKAEFCYGNIIRESIADIMSKRERVANKIDLKLCPLTCSGTFLNLALHRLINKTNHENFL